MLNTDNVKLWREIKLLNLGSNVTYNPKLTLKKILLVGSGEHDPYNSPLSAGSRALQNQRAIDVCNKSFVELAGGQESYELKRKTALASCKLSKSCLQFRT